ncbi:hypothetical protein J6590_068548 [Homalodisca vitripennis]|nr:hypothetical protein J6590_068548 [Homalodisca vitripennis]
MECFKVLQDEIYLELKCTLKKFHTATLREKTQNKRRACTRLYKPKMYGVCPINRLRVRFGEYENCFQHTRMSVGIFTRPDNTYFGERNSGFALASKVEKGIGRQLSSRRKRNVWSWRERQISGSVQYRRTPRRVAYMCRGMCLSMCNTDIKLFSRHSVALPLTVHRLPLV